MKKRTEEREREEMCNERNLKKKYKDECGMGKEDKKGKTVIKARPSYPLSYSGVASLCPRVKPSCSRGQDNLT